MALEFKDKQLLVKAVGSLFGTSTETAGQTTVVEVLGKGKEARYEVGNKLIVYSNALMEIKSPYFKEEERLIESDAVGRGVICNIADEQ